jgi:hypothetical protein
MISVPEVGDKVTISVSGEVTQIRVDKNEDGGYEFQIHVKAPDGDTYVVNIPRPGVSVVRTPQTTFTSSSSNLTYWKND